MNFDMYSPQLMKQSLVSAYNGLALGGIVMDYGSGFEPNSPEMQNLQLEDRNNEIKKLEKELAQYDRMSPYTSFTHEHNKEMAKKRQRLKYLLGEISVDPYKIDSDLPKDEPHGEANGSNGLSTNPLISQTSTLTSILRVIAMGVAYQRNKSLLRAFGASLVPAPYLVYVGYDAYVKKNKN